MPALLVLGAAGLSAFNLISRLVESQRREIGIGMAMGVPPAQLAVRPLLFGAQVALIGVVFGVGALGPANGLVCIAAGDLDDCATHGGDVGGLAELFDLGQQLAGHARSARADGFGPEHLAVLADQVQPVRPRLIRLVDLVVELVDDRGHGGRIGGIAGHHLDRDRATVVKATM